MRRFLTVSFILLAVAASAVGWQWPMSSFSVSTVFGQTWDGAYSRGMELTGDVQTVYPASSGTVIYVSGPQPRGASQLGIVVVVEHGRGFRSFYGHLEEGTVPEPGTAVTETTAIGRVGQTGLAERPTLFFSILDTEAGAYVNPLLLLPVIEDRVRPTVVSVLAQSESALYDLTVARELPSGEYLILVECEDQIVRNGDRLAPYSLAVIVDGKEQMAVACDRIVFADGYPRVQPGPAVQHDGLRSGDGSYVTGPVVVPVGRTLIEVIASDFSGNERTVALEVNGHP